MNEVTLVQHYNLEGPSWLARVKACVANALDDASYQIEHVGSTAIPGMTAKPIIDIDIIVELQDFPLIKARLALMGYLHQGDLGIPDREAFALTDPPMALSLPSHHLYVCMAGAAALRDHLRFRDFMRMHPDWVEKLSKHKVQLCEQYNNDRQRYMDGKEDMMGKIISLTLGCDRC